MYLLVRYDCAASVKPISKPTPDEMSVPIVTADRRLVGHKLASEHQQNPDTSAKMIRRSKRLHNTKFPVTQSRSVIERVAPIIMLAIYLVVLTWDIWTSKGNDKDKSKAQMCVLANGVGFAALLSFPILSWIRYVIEDRRQEYIYELWKASFDEDWQDDTSLTQLQKIRLRRARAMQENRYSHLFDGL